MTMEMFAFITNFLTLSGLVTSIANVNDISIGNSKTDVTLSNIHLTWTEAQSKCPLAAINFEAGTDIKSVKFEVSNGAASATEAWIGAYVQYSKWINFDGCFYGYTDGKSYKNTISVQECLEYCGEKFVLRLEGCYCTSSITISDEICQPKECSPNSNNIGFCGFQDTTIGSTKHYCFCTYNALDADFGQEVGCCQAFSYVAGVQKFHTKDGNENLKSKCRYTNYDHYSLSTDEKGWTEAGLLCYDTKEHFAGIDVKDSAKIESSDQYWIGVFRENEFHWGSPIGSVKRYGCISVTVNGSGQLTKYVRNCDKKLPSFCDGILDINDTVTSVGITGQQTTSSLSQNAPTTIRISQPMTDYAPPSQLPQTGTENDKSGVVLAVVIVAIIVVIIIGICLWIFFYRRKTIKRGEMFSFASIPLVVRIRKLFTRKKKSIKEQPRDLGSGEEAEDENVYDHLGRHNEKREHTDNEDLYDHAHKPNPNREDLYHHLENYSPRQPNQDTSEYDVMENVKRENTALYDAMKRTPGGKEKISQGPSSYEHVWPDKRPNETEKQ